VPTTVLPDTPITGDLPPERIADLIDQGAQLIATHGLEIGDLWPDALLRPYEPGDPCCTAGALAVVCGFRRAEDVEEMFTATTPDPTVPDDIYPPWTPHPVFAAVIAELGFTKPEDLYDWSDTATGTEVMEALREAAAKIRAQAGGAAS
jgi:hypothetical protein